MRCSFYFSGAVVLLLEVSEGKRGVFQSDPRVIVAALPLVVGGGCFDGGSTCGSLIIDINASSPSDGRSKLRM